MAPLLHLPFELFLLITSFLDVSAILALRMTCQCFASWTTNRSIWMDQFNGQRSIVPFGEPVVQDLSTTDLEQLLRSAHRVQEAWLLRRNPTVYILPQSYRGILMLEIYLEKWLVVVTSKTVDVWDIHYLREVRGTARLQASVTLPVAPYISSAAVFDRRARIVTIGLTCSASFESGTLVLRVLLEDKLRPNTLINVSVALRSYYSFTIQAITDGPNSTLIVLSNLHHIIIMDWVSNACVTIDTAITLPLDEIWNSNIAIQVCGDTLLCVNHVSVHLYPLPALRSSDGPNTIYSTVPASIHRFTSVHFREASISALSLHSDSTFFTLLAHDPVQGLFFYRISITRAGLEVVHLNTYPLDSTLGFIADFCIGPEGKRGLWIQRVRSDTRRTVMAFNFAPIPESSTTSDIDLQVQSATIYEVRSLDLRDDLTLGSFSEVSGQIVFGTRAGAIHILECLRNSSRMSTSVVNDQSLATV